MRARMAKSQYPLCACGCGVQVHRRSNRYASVACVPISARQAGGRKAQAVGTLRRRTVMFKADLDQLPQRLTREDLLVLLMRVYRRGVHTGVQQGQREARGYQWTSDAAKDAGRKGGQLSALLRARERGAA